MQHSVVCSYLWCNSITSRHVCCHPAAAAAYFSLMWTKHWEHHNMCGTPKEDPDFHQGESSRQQDLCAVYPPTLVPKVQLPR